MPLRIIQSPLSMKPIPLFCFDIETEPQPADELLARFNPVFEPAGNLKDPEKIAADIAAKLQKWIDDSALHAERGRILAFGFSVRGSGPTVIHGEDEEDLLFQIIASLRDAIQDGELISGFNIIGFDLPFIRKRCLINGIRFPWYNPLEKWNQWGFKAYDAMLDWQCGVRGGGTAEQNAQTKLQRLDTVARALGVGQKTGDGANFAKLYREDRGAALEYLRNDVSLTRAVCERLLGE